MPTCIQEISNYPSFDTNTSIDCLYLIVAPYYTITYTVPTAITGITQYTIWFGPLINPASCLTTNSFQVTFSGSDGGSITSGLIRSYTPAAINSASITPASYPNTLAGASDTYTFLFRITNNIPLNGYVQITFPTTYYSGAPSGLTSSSITAFEYGNQVTSTMSVIYPSGQSQVIQISGMTSNAALVALASDTTKYVSISISGITNPNTVGVTTTFQIATMDSNKKLIDRVLTGLYVNVTEPGTLTINTFLASSKVVDAASYLTFDVTPSVFYSSGGYIEVVAPYPYITETLSTGTICQAQQGFDTSSVATCSTQLNSYTVQFVDDLDTTQTSEYFYILSFINPLGVLTLPSYKLYYVNPDNTVVAQTLTGLSYTTTPGQCYVTSAVRSSSVLTVGLNGEIYTVSFNCDHRIRSVGYVMFLFPIEQMGYNSTSAMTCSKAGVTTTSYACTISSNGTYLNVTVPQWCTSTTTDCTYNTSMSIQFNNVQNPGYIVPTSLQPSVQIFTLNPINGSYYVIDQVVSGVKFTGTLIPGVISNLVITRPAYGSSYTLTGGSTKYQFVFTSATLIPQNGYIQLTFPYKTVYASTLSCTSSVGSGTCSDTLNPADTTQILYVNFTGACTTSSGCSKLQGYTLTAYNFLNAFSTQPNSNLTFKVQTYNSQGYMIDSGTGTATTLTLTANALTATLSQPATPIVVGAIDTYAFSIKNPNNYIPSTGGCLVITLPTQITVQSGATCTATTTFTLTCTINTATTPNTVNITSPTYDIAINSAITITFTNNIQNPITGAPSGAFTLSSYYYGIYSIDTVTGLTVTCDTSNLVTNVVSTRSGQDKSESITLTICFETTNPIPTNGIITFIIPTNQAVLSTTFSSTVTTGTTSVSSSATTVKVTEWCSSTSTCASGNTQCIPMTGFINPSTSIVSTTSIIINITTSASYIVDAITAGVITIPYVRNGPLDSLTIARVNDVVGQVPTYTFTFTTDPSTGTLTGSSAIVLVAFPVGFLYNKTSVTSCSVQNSGGSSVSTTCSITVVATDAYKMGTYIQTLTANLKCTTLTCTGGETFIFTLTGTGLSNPFNTKSPNGGIITLATQQTTSGSLQVVNSLDLTIGTDVIFNSFTTDAIAITSITRSTTMVGQYVEIEIKCTMPTRLMATGYVEIYVPLSQFTTNGAPIKWEQGTSFGTFSAVKTTFSYVTNTTYAYVQLTEWCDNGGYYCPDNTALVFKLTSGFNNLRYVAPPTNYFAMLTQTNDQLGNVDYLNPALETYATLNLTAETIVIKSIALSKSYVAATAVNLDIEMNYVASLSTGDYVTFNFTGSFIRDDLGSVTCADITSGTVTKTCVVQSANNVVTSVVIKNVCLLSNCSTVQTLRIANVGNILEQEAFSGNLTITASTSAGYTIAQVVYDTSTYATLLPGQMTSVSVVRNVAYQGSNANYTFTFTTNGIVQNGSYIELDLPFDQILPKTNSVFLAKESSTVLSLNYLTASSLYNYTTFTSWKCVTSNCDTNQTYSLTVYNSMNPYIQSTSSYTDFVIKIMSASANIMFESSSPLVATPALIYGLITNINITQSLSSYVNLKTAYTFTFTTSSDIPQGGLVKITFPPNRAYKDSTTSISCTANSKSVTAYSTWTYNSLAYPILTINVTTMCSTAACTAGTFVIYCSGGMKNPPSVSSITTNFTIDATKSTGNIIDEGTIFNSLVTAILPQPIDVTVTRGSTYMSQLSTYTVSFTTVNTIPVGGYVRIIIPLDQVTIPSDEVACLDVSESAIYCEVIYASSTSLWLNVNYSTCITNNIFVTTCTASTSVTIYLTETYNPSYFSANSVTSTWQIYTMNSSFEYIDGDYSGVVATPDLIGESVLILDTQLTSTLVYTDTTFLIKFQTGITMTSDAIFDIYFPNLLFKDLGKTQCEVISYDTIGFYCEFTTNATSGYLEKVSLMNPCPFDCDATTSYLYSIPVQTRGDLYPVGGTFKVYTSYSYMDVGYGSFTNTLSLKAGSITNYYISNKGCGQVDAVCTLYLYFEQINPIPTKTNNGRIYIEYPSELTAESSYCSMEIAENSYSDTCEVGVNSETVIATHNYTGVLQYQNISVVMMSMRNPDSTAPTDAFVIRTQAGYADSSGTIVYYDIDTNTSGIFYQINQTSPFGYVTVTRDSMTNNNGYLTGQPTRLTFQMELTHALSDTAQFQFQLPSAAQVMFATIVTGYTCYSVDASLVAQNVLLCTFESSNNTIIVQNLCYVTNCGVSDIVRFKVYDDFIQNYYYVVTPLNYTRDSISIWSTTADGYYFIDGATSGIFATPALEPNTLIMPSPEIIRTANVVYQEVEWVINFKINMNPVPANGYVTIQVPIGVLFEQGNNTLEIYDYDTNDIYKNVTYTKWNDTQQTINLITIGNFCNRSNGTAYVVNCSIGVSYSIYIDGIQNPPSQIYSDYPIIVQTMTVEGYIIEQGITPVINSLFSQLIPLKISKIQIQPINPIPNVVTDYQFFISNEGIAFNPTDILLIYFPSELTLLNKTATSRILSSSGYYDSIPDRCSNIFEPYYGVTCGVIGNNLLQVSGLFVNDIQYYGLYVKDIQNPTTNMTTAPLQFTVQNTQNLSIASRTTQTTVLIYPILEANASCSKFCNTCAGSNSTCTSCPVPSAYPILKDYSCMDTCGDGYFFMESNLKCYPCYEACSTCYGAGNNKCYGCASGFYFQNGVCLPSCTLTAQENSATHVCQNSTSKCDPSCLTCSTDATYCLSCDTSNPTYAILDPMNGKCIANDQSLCNLTVSSNFFINETSQECEQCTELCKTCTDSSSTCTSCQSFFSKNILSDLYQTCVDSCGLGTFYNATDNVCSWCNPICMLCTGHGADECTVCNKTPEAKQLYFYENQCVLSCPKGWSVDLNTYDCVQEEIDYLSFVYLFVGACVVFTILTIILSCLFSCCKNKFFDILYALLSIMECLNRACLLGNLWVKSSVFTLAVCFMCMIATSAIGVFFNFLFMSPIYAHSPHFRTLYKQHTCAYQFVTFLSYIGGVNVMRLLTSKLMGCRAFASDLTEYKFYFQPLNTMANFTLIFTLAQGGICGYCLFQFTVYDDVYVLSAFGAVLNFLFLLMQVVKHFLVKLQLSRYDAKNKVKSR